MTEKGRENCNNKPEINSGWAALNDHQQKIKTIRIRDLFATDAQRFENFSLQVGDLLLDYSKQCVTNESIEKLVNLCKEKDLAEKITSLFSGGIVNHSENRAALHVALRNLDSSAIFYHAEHVLPHIQTTLAAMEKFSENINKGIFRNESGYVITDVICLGIGGSELGPSFVSHALESYRVSNIKLHFISNVFGPSLLNQLNRLNPKTTLCIISSKTFTTPETMLNAKIVKDWFLTNQISSHLIAVTANKKRAIDFEIQEDLIFEFWDWVGGRFSIWSAVGLPVMLIVGRKNFREFLRGAAAMDQHFLTAPFQKNMPVIMALLGIWNSNFLGMMTHLIMPYDDRLKDFPAYLQQLEMESNGKNCDEKGNKISHTTAPIIWGNVGCNGQHAFMQLLHQGTQRVPVDFLIPTNIHEACHEQQQLLLASCLMQSKALMEGGASEIGGGSEANGGSGDEKDRRESLGFTYYPGNSPSNTLMYPDLTPYILGKLIALYEHKVFVQGVIWGINSFDQWGVELGKKLTQKLLPLMEDFAKMDDDIVDNKINALTEEMDSSTLGLLTFYRNQNKIS